MSIKEELARQRVAHLDLSAFCQVQAGTPVEEVLAAMRAQGRNVCLVLQGDNLVGIFTERDVLRKVVGQEAVLAAPIDEVMTPDPLTVSPELSAGGALALMDEKHFRNLPVVDEHGRVVGDMTHRAIIDYLASRYPREVLNRPPHADRFPRKPEGG